MKQKLYNKPIFFLSGCLLTPILALAGCIFGYGWYLHDLEPVDTWKSLGTPIDQVSHLLAARTSTIYVQTNEGKILSCYRESQYDRSCWKLVDAIPEDDLGSSPYPLSSPIPPLPNEVIESLAVQYDIDSPVYEGHHIFAYLLLSDGAVMQWISEPIGWFPPPNQFTRLTFKSLGGSCIGVLSGIGVILILLWFVPRKS